MSNRNPMAWTGRPGHYEVWYVTLTDPASGIGAWVRLTLLAPLRGPATCSLWLLAMDPAHDEVIGRRASFPIKQLAATAEPFRLTVAGAHLDDHGTAGAFQDVAWDLRWAPAQPAFHVHPLLERAKLAKTVLTLPHADLEISGTLTLPGGRTVEVQGARGGQAHLWGAKHATRWAWAHASDLETSEGEPRPGTWLDAVSVVVPRLGRDVGPSTPVVGRFLGDDFRATSPVRVLRAPSAFGLTSWRFEATDGARRIAVAVDAPRRMLAGVVYHDPDGALAHCYNSEVASIGVSVFDREATKTVYPWRLLQTLRSSGRAHFEYAQREPVAGMALHVGA